MKAVPSVLSASAVADVGGRHAGRVIDQKDEAIALKLCSLPTRPHQREHRQGHQRQLQEQQAKTSWIIGGFAVLLAAVAAYLLARGFLAPLKRLADATHRIAAGDPHAAAQLLAEALGNRPELRQSQAQLDAVRAHVRATVREKLLVANPGYLPPDASA